MLTKAVRLYGKNDLRIEKFELPEIKETEILAKVVCDSICMSTYKAALQGKVHKRIPEDVSINPVIIGHEFSGALVEIGSKWSHKFKPGDKFSIQPALNYENGPVGILSAPGYSYKYIGGDATYVIIPEEVMQQNCLLLYKGEGYYPAALAEPLSCVIGAMNANYHNRQGSYMHEMGIIDNGNMAILAGVGPMGLAAINYTISRVDRKPKLLVVTDIDEIRLKRAADLYPVELAFSKGIDLKYINTSNTAMAVEQLKFFTDGRGYDDVFVFAPVASVIEQADDILAFNGCLNFFAGPSYANFKAPFNFYNVHYQSTHLVGTSGGNSEDIVNALEYISNGFDPSGLITHIGGINCVPETVMQLPTIPGGKKLIYTHIEMGLTAISDFEKKGSKDLLFRRLDSIVKGHNNLWSQEAEEFLLKNHPSL